MQRFLRSYAALAVIAFVIQLVGAFAIGAIARSRWDESSGMSYEAVPAPIPGGFEAALGVAFFTIVGFALRWAAYSSLDRSGVRSRIVWWAIVVGEAIFIALNFWLVFATTTPEVDAGFGWLLIGFLALIVTGLSGAALIAAIIVSRRRKAREPQPVA